jgi:hypothetical protein
MSIGAEGWRTHDTRRRTRRVRGRCATVVGRWDGGDRRRGALMGRRLSPHRRRRVWSAVANGSAPTAAGTRHRLIDHGVRTLPSLPIHTSVPRRRSGQRLARTHTHPPLPLRRFGRLAEPVDFPVSVHESSVRGGRRRSSIYFV